MTYSSDTLRTSVPFLKTLFEPDYLNVLQPLCISTAQKMKFSIKDFFSKYQIRRMKSYWRNPQWKTSFFVQCSNFTQIWKLALINFMPLAFVLYLLSSVNTKSQDEILLKKSSMKNFIFCAVFKFYTNLKVSINQFHATSICFIPPENNKNKGFLMRSEGIERDQCYEIG